MLITSPHKTEKIVSGRTQNLKDIKPMCYSVIVDVHCEHQQCEQCNVRQSKNNKQRAINHKTMAW